MINKIFQQKVPFVYNYFSTLLELINQNQRKFPQSIIFEGADIHLQYLFSLELARILNCREEKASNCNCTNCRWIKNMEHPGVNNVSQIHFKPDGDESKTVISVKQSALIEKTLAVSSDYHRFFIFFSSSEKEYNENELTMFKEFGIEKEINFTIEPLKYNTFNPASLNALLKSVEEPPLNTTFIFLAKSKEDILPTIVSRSLIFKMANNIKKINPNEIQNLFCDYFNITFDNAFDISQNAADFIKEKDIELDEVLYMLLEYVKQLLLNNINNNQVYNLLMREIKYIKEALMEANIAMSEKNILESLFLSIAKGRK